MGSTKMKSNANKHPHAGKHFVVESGKLKGLTIKVSDFLQNQFQGKSIKALSKRADIAPLIAQLEGRGFKLTESTLYAFGPDKQPLLVDDSEIQVTVKEKPKLKVVHDPELHSHGQEVEDDSGESSGEDSGDAGGTRDEGRGVLSGTAPTEDKGEAGKVGQSDSKVGGVVGGAEKATPRTDKPKAGTGSKAAPNKPRGNNSTK